MYIVLRGLEYTYYRHLSQGLTLFCISRDELLKVSQNFLNLKHPSYAKTREEAITLVCQKLYPKFNNQVNPGWGMSEPPTFQPKIVEEAIKLA